MWLVNYTSDPLLENISWLQTASQARHADIRELHIGLVNLMPDSAYFSTIIDWGKLLNISDQSLHIHMHYINLNWCARRWKAQLHASKYGKTLKDALSEWLDWVICTGADLETSWDKISDLAFYEEFSQIIYEIESGSITSWIFSCFSFHMLMEIRYGVKKTIRQKKNWGVFKHTVPQWERQHYLNRWVDSSFNSISSRWWDITASDIKTQDVTILNYCENEHKSIGAITDKKMNFLWIQTHPEYDDLWLLKEFLRDFNLWEVGIDDIPDFINPSWKILLEKYMQAGKIESEQRKEIYKKIYPHINITWKNSGILLIHKWISWVLKLTGYDRHVKYMDWVDANNPINFLD